MSLNHTPTEPLLKVAACLLTIAYYYIYSAGGKALFSQSASFVIRLRIYPGASVSHGKPNYTPREETSPARHQ